MNAVSAPIETKVVAGGAAGWITGVLTWILVTYVFKSGLPDQLATFLPYVVANICAVTAGYFAKHTPRLDEVAAQVEAILGVPVPGHAGDLPAAPAQPPWPPAGT